MWQNLLRKAMTQKGPLANENNKYESYPGRQAGSRYNEWRALVNAVMNCRGLYNVWNVSNSLENLRFSCRGGAV
jgi:hypothetical protein